MAHPLDFTRVLQSEGSWAPSQIRQTTTRLLQFTEQTSQQNHQNYNGKIDITTCHLHGLARHRKSCSGQFSDGTALVVENTASAWTCPKQSLVPRRVLREPPHGAHTLQKRTANPTCFAAEIHHHRIVTQDHDIESSSGSSGPIGRREPKMRDGFVAVRAVHAPCSHPLYGVFACSKTQQGSQ